MKKLRLVPELLSRNGQTRVKIIARDEDDRIVEADTITLESSAARRRLAERLARLDGSLSTDIDAELRGIIDQAQAIPRCDGGEQPSSTALLDQMPAAVRAQANATLRSPNLIGRIQSDLQGMGITGDEVTALGVYLTGTSRLLDRPLASIVQGASSAGKSYIIRTVGRLFPGESKVVAHQLSPRALYYMGDDALVHRFVIGGERPRQQKDQEADATKQLREMISDSELTSITVETASGTPKSIQTRTRGPIAFVESASSTQINPEDLNRCLVFPVDESRRQTDAICESMAAAYAGEVPRLGEEIVPVHHAMQRMLQARRVVIPFARLIASAFPKDRIEARRGLGHVFHMIEAVALLRQFQKEQDPADDLLADADDYAAAVPLLRPTLDRLCGRLDTQSRRVWDELCARLKYSGEKIDGVPTDEFTRTTIAAWTGTNETTAGGRLRALATAGYLVLSQEPKGNRKGVWRINSQHPQNDIGDELGLPGVAQVRAEMEGV